MGWFDPVYLIFIAPALLLALWAQMRVKATYAAARQEPAQLSGAAAARFILDSDGLQSVRIEQIPGELSDHYDPRDRVLRLSPEVYQGRTLASVGIAAHEAGHALQHHHAYAPLAIRNAAVPVASFGSGVGVIVIILGAIMQMGWLFWAGIALFGAVVFFQLVNLPVEFDASRRAKALLVERGIVPREEMAHVNSVLNAAAWTYVAATLQSVMILLYYITRFSGNSRD
jgi:Zn-dependent membrane protease YugP